MSLGFKNDVVMWKPEVQGYVYLDRGEKDSLIYKVYDRAFRDGLCHESVINEIEFVEQLDKDDKFPFGTKTVPLIIVKPENIQTVRKMERSVACCAFNATDTYLKHFLGTQLDHDDNKWYSKNSLCTSDGLPQRHTFTVLQQLVEPYGIGISRIVVPRNGRVFPEYKPFMKSLGCNPFFLQDGKTTNEEALQQLFPDQIERDKARFTLLAQWRFECLDTPPTGCIMMRIFSDSPGHNGGSSYRGVRSKDKADGWTMCINFERLTNIHYIRPIELPEYKEFEGDLEFDFLSIKIKDDKTIRQYSYDITAKKWDNRNFDYRGRQLPPPVDNWKKEKFPKFCPTCQYSIGDFYQSGKRTCIECGNAIEPIREISKEENDKKTAEALEKFFNRDIDKDPEDLSYTD